MKLQELSYN